MPVVKLGSGPPAGRSAEAVAGWHGKLPALGDFASRRLDAAVIEAWDGWLAAGLLALRERDPAHWLQAYLDSPSWRFLLLPGVLPGAAGPQAWCGVLMPSVDRVGRYFPFTALLPLPTLPASGPQMAALWDWLARLDALAADAMQDDWTLVQLEDALAALGGPESAATTNQAAPAPADDAAAAIDRQALAAWQRAQHGQALWFADTERGGRRLWQSSGLPAGAALAALLGAAEPAEALAAADPVLR